MKKKPRYHGKKKKKKKRNEKKNVGCAKMRACLEEVKNRAQ